MQQITLIGDAISNRKKDAKGRPYLYGKKGDKVKLISVMGNVLIVEADGNRFPVKVELTDYAKDL